MDGFGVVAMVAMTPLVTIQILGAVYAVKESRIAKKSSEAITEIPCSAENDDLIIDFE